MRIGIIGLGVMGMTILKALRSAREVGLVDEVLGCDRNAEKVEKAQKEGLTTIDYCLDLLDQSNICIFAIKKKDVLELLRKVPKAQALRNRTQNKVYIFLSAGFNLSEAAQLVGEDQKLVKVMPNVNIAIGEGVLGILYNPILKQKAHQSTRTFIKQLFSKMGRICEISETQMNAVTGLSGSGPAYVFLFIEALADGGVHAGLSRDVALELAGQTVLGAAKLYLQTKQHPAHLKDMVASPSGTTIEGIRTLEKYGFRSAIMEAVVQAALRSALLEKSL